MSAPARSPVPGDDEEVLIPLALLFGGASIEGIQRYAAARLLTAAKIDAGHPEAAVTTAEVEQAIRAYIDRYFGR